MQEKKPNKRDSETQQKKASSEKKKSKKSPKLGKSSKKRQTVGKEEIYTKLITQNSPKRKTTLLTNFSNRPYYFKSHTSLNSNSKSRILNEIVNEIPLIDNNCSDLSVTNLTNSQITNELANRLIKKKNKQFEIKENHTFGQNSLFENLSSRLKYSPKLKKMQEVKIKTRQSEDSNAIKRSGDNLILNLFPQVPQPTIEMGHFKTARNSLNLKDVQESKDFKNQNFYTLQNISHYKEKVEIKNFRNLSKSDLKLKLATVLKERDFLEKEIEVYKIEILKLEDNLDEKINLLEDRDEYISYLKNKYKENSDLENFRGNLNSKMREEILNLRNQIKKKEEEILQLAEFNYSLEMKNQTITDFFKNEINELNSELKKSQLIENLTKKNLSEMEKEIIKKNEDFKNNFSNYQKAESFIIELKDIIEKKDKSIANLIENLKTKENKINEVTKQLNKLKEIFSKQNNRKNNLDNSQENSFDKQSDYYEEIKINEIRNNYEKIVAELREENSLLKEFHDRYKKEKKEENKNNINYVKDFLEENKEKKNLIFLDKFVQKDDILPKTNNNQNLLNFKSVQCNLEKELFKEKFVQLNKYLDFDISQLVNNYEENQDFFLVYNFLIDRILQLKKEGLKNQQILENFMDEKNNLNSKNFALDTKNKNLEEEMEKNRIDIANLHIILNAKNNEQELLKTEIENLRKNLNLAQIEKKENLEQILLVKNKLSNKEYEINNLINLGKKTTLQKSTQTEIIKKKEITTNTSFIIQEKNEIIKNLQEEKIKKLKKELFCLKNENNALMSKIKEKKSEMNQNQEEEIKELKKEIITLNNEKNVLILNLKETKNNLILLENTKKEILEFKKKNEEVIFQNTILQEKINNMKNAISTKTKLYSEELECLKKKFEESKIKEQLIKDLENDKKQLLVVNNNLEKKLSVFQKDLEIIKTNNNDSFYDIRKNLFLEMISQKETIQLFLLFIKKITSSKILIKKIKSDKVFINFINSL